MNRPTLRLDVVKSAVRNLLLQHPELADDEDLRLTAIEGETDALEAIDQLVTADAEDTAVMKALDIRIQQIRSRKERCEKRIDKRREALTAIMLAADLKSIPLAEATITLANGTPKLVVSTAAEIPNDLLRSKTTISPDLDALRQAVKAGRHIPGVSMTNGAPSLRIRRG
jgi:uncharacterized protein YqgV (UPF0045/DUF77 family)